MIQELLFVSMIVLKYYDCVTGLVVYTGNGGVSGTKFTTYQGKVVDAFLGIPYSKPPVKDNRFRDPQPVDSWEGVRSADSYGSMCVQYIYYHDLPVPVIGNEDCLFLNIYTPHASNTSKLNVIVFIHGGCFMFGDGNSYTPYYLMDYYDLVFVTLNYRLGPLGFLSTEDNVIPGNFGLKDQVQALKWIRDNIEHFGGNKEEITITGNSAGGVSVHLHYMSPLSRDLFKNGISESGTALNPWAMSDSPLQKAKMLSAEIGCPTNTSEAMMKCLQNKDVVSIFKPIKKLFLHWVYNPFSPFGPVVEPKASNSFISETPYKMIAKGEIKDAPWMTYVTTEEGLYPAATFIFNKTLMDELEENWDTIAPHLLDFNYTVSQKRKIEVSGKIRKYYMGEKRINESGESLVKLLTERLFSVGTEKAIRLQAAVSKSPVFFFVFGYQGNYSVSYALCRCNTLSGVSHVDSTLYLLKTPFSNLNNMSGQDMITINSMVNIWTSFANSSSPLAEKNLILPPVSPDIGVKGNLTYFLLASTNEIKSTKRLTNFKFWDGLGLMENDNIPSNGIMVSSNNLILLIFPYLLFYSSFYPIVKDDIPQ